MTRKDFELIATILAGAKVNQEFSETFPVSGEEMRLQIAGEFGRLLGNTNPRFDRARFLKACEVQS